MTWLLVVLIAVNVAWTALLTVWLRNVSVGFKELTQAHNALAGFAETMVAEKNHKPKKRATQWD